MRVELLNPRGMAEGDQLLDGQGQDAGGHLDRGLHDDGQNVENRVEYILELATALDKVVGGLQE